MDINKQFPSKYITAADLDKPVSVRIAIVKVEEMQSREGVKEPKPVLYFSNAQKGLVLNKGNATIIADRYGSETDSWGGQLVTLYKDRVLAWGEMVDAVRVRIEDPAQQQQMAEPTHNPAAQPSPTQPRPKAVTPDQSYEESDIPF